MFTKSLVKCVLCKANINLRRGNLDKFKGHLDSFHEAIFDVDLIISISFLETEEKERIVGTVFPRIKKFFKDLSIANVNQEPRVLAIEKKLEEEGVFQEVKASIRERSRSKRELENKYESLKEDVEPMRKKVKVEQNQQIESTIRIENIKSSAVNNESFDSAEPTLNRKSPGKDDVIENIHDEGDKVQEDEESLSQKFVNPGESSCDICDKVMLKKSVRKHKQRVHHLFEDNIDSTEDSRQIPDHSEAVVAADDVTEIVEEVTKEKVPNVPDELLVITPSQRNADKGTPKGAANKNVNCEVCNKSIFKKNIARHMKTVHPRNDESEDTEGDDRDNCEDKVVEEAPEEICVDVDPVEEDNDSLVIDEEEKDNISPDSIETEPFSRGLVNESEEGVEKEVKESRVECPHCQKKVTRSNLRRHVRNIHGDEEDSRPIRGQSSGDQSEAGISEEEDIMDQSEASVSDTEENSEADGVENKCKICFAMFEDKAELSEHFRVVHDIDIEDFENLDNEDE